MTFDQPYLLLALVLAPLAYLVGRLRRRRIEVEVSSLLLYERALARLAQNPPAAVERRRRADRRLLAEAIALGALAVAAAGPRLASGPPPRTVGLVLDDSPSMASAGRPAAAEEAERALRASLGPDDTLLVARASDAPGGDLGLAAAALRARGADPVHAITDHDPAGAAGVRAILVGGGGANRGIVAAGARAGEVLVRTSAVGFEGAGDAEVIVSDAAGTEVARGRGGEVRAPLPADAARRGPLRVQIAGDDALALDDRATLEPPGAPRPVALRGAAPPEAIRAIEAAGGRIAAAGEAAALEVEIAAAPGDGPPPERLIAPESARFRHSDLAGQRVRVAPAPPPAEPGLAPLLVDERGRVLVAFRETARGARLWIGIPLGLGDAATDWPRRRTFPVFFAEALGAPPTDWTALGVLSASETLESGPSSPSPAPALAPLPSTVTARGRPLSSPVLLAAALAALAAWSLARERLAGGPSCAAS